MKNKDFLSLAMIVFLVVGVVHLYRAFNNIPVAFGATLIPVWISWFAGAFALYLSYSAYNLKS